MENKNTVIALVLMLVVWFGYSVLFPPRPAENVNAPLPGQEETLSATPTVAESDQTREEEVVSEPIAAPQPAPAVVGRELMVETDAFRAVFTSSGARLLSLELKHYHQAEDPESPLVSLIDVDNEELGSLRLAGAEGLGLAADLPYSVSIEDESIRLEGDQERSVVFTGTTAGGLRVEKVFTFSGSGYDFELEMRIANQAASTARGSLVLSLVHPWDESMAGKMYEFVGPVTLVGEDLQTDKVEDVAESPGIYPDGVWTAFENKYFLSAVVPLEEAAERIRVEKTAEAVVNQVETPPLSVAPGETARFNYLLYFGPRDLDILKTVDHQLDRAIDFGFFSLLALPLRHVLTFFNGFVGNYGVAIILLTVLIKLLFWPLTHKSYASMKAMQKLQPEMQKIREKFKNDRERMNRELMEMYKTHRVNPLGGCLPMLVQIPVFFALYRVLLGDIALRHAPFMLWITDLSAKDPYYVTPIIMGGTMFLQQKMTPSTMDPTQAKMFMIMPVVFTFLFLNFPAGLVIYWLTNNLLTIAQQMYINRKA